MLAVRGEATVAPLMPAILREVEAVHDAETFDVVTKALCGVAARECLTVALAVPLRPLGLTLDTLAKAPCCTAAVN